MASALEVINEDVVRIRKAQEYASEGDAFAHWYLTRRFTLVDSEAADACSVSGSKDKGFDAIWFDDDQKTIFALQAKYSRDATAGFTNEDANKLRASMEFILDQTRLANVTNQVLRERLHEAQERIQSRYTVQFYLIVLGSITTEAREELRAVRKAHEGVLQVFTHEVTDILNLIPSTKETVDIVDDIPVIGNEIFEHEHDSHKSLIVAVSALTLAKLREDHGDLLFEENVRFFLGQKGPNKEMVESLRTADGRANFWFYHNGVTAVCRKFTPSKDKRKVHVEGFQIVNGCQTTVTLHETKPMYEHQPEVPKLLMRIIQTQGDDLFLRKISKYTNSQSKVDDRDLASKDKIQEDLQRDLARAGYFCEIKRGEWNTLTQDKKKKYITASGQELRVDNIEIAKAIMCWEGKPAEAKSRKAAHFQSEPVGGYYEMIFKPTRTSWEYLAAQKVLSFAEQKRKDFQAVYREHERKQFADLDDDERKTLEARVYIIHAETMLASYLSQIVREKVAEKHMKELVKSLDAGHWSAFDYLFDLVDQIMTETVKERNREQAFQMSRYFKSSKAYADVRAAIGAQMNLLKKVAGRDPLEGFTTRLAKAGVPAG